MNRENIKVRLGEVCTVVSGSTPKSNNEEYWGGNNKWITPAELKNDSYFVYDTERHITEKAIKDTSLKLLPKGTVLLSSRAPIGKVAIVGNEMFCNQGFKNLVCSQVIDNKYLFFFLKYNKLYLEKLGRGATFKELSKTIVENIEISLPDKNIQVQNVKVLEKIDCILALLNKENQLLDELVQSRFIEMFGDLSENSKKWSTNTLGNLSCFMTSGSRGWAKYYSENGDYFLTIKNVKNSRISLNNVTYVNPPAGKETQRTRVQKNDLLISITADLGRTGVVTQDIADHGAYINQHLLLLRLNKELINPQFLSYQLESDLIRSQINKRNNNSVKAGLNFNSVSSIKVYCPPLILQDQFAEFKNKIDKSKYRLVLSEKWLKTLFKNESKVF